MRTIAGIERVPFSEAKNNLSNFVSDVVRKHSLRLLERGRGAEEMLALSAEDVPAGFAACRLDTQVSFGEHSVVARLPQFGLVASGANFDAAIDALHDELLEYCEDFFSDYAFYRQTSRIADLPFLLRFALTPTDARRALLLEEPGDRRPAAPREVALPLAR